MKKMILLVVVLILIGIFALVSARMIETQVQIHKGWNLILGFVEPEALSGKLDSSSIKAIYAFIPTTQEYTRVYPNPENDKLQSMDDDYMRQTSFWVYSDAETGEELNGVMNAEEYMIEEAPVPLNQHQLYKGWNFLAYIPEMQDKTLDDIKGTCNIEKAYLWKFDDRSADRGWVKMPMNGKFVGNRMLMMGFIVKVQNNCELGASNSVSPPSIPETLPSSSCLDNDGGEDYYVKGIVTASEGGVEFTGEDQCGASFDNNPSENPNQLNEKYCKSGGSSAAETLFICPKGCSNGACIQ